MGESGGVWDEGGGNGGREGEWREKGGGREAMPAYAFSPKQKNLKYKK